MRPRVDSCNVANQLQTAISSAGTTTNTWNYENQLTGVVLSSGARVTMTYNADFRRVYNGE